MDHYQTLGVDRNATEDDIKKAYRKLAMKHHPDRTGGDDTKFKEIQTAYATLGDPQKRAEYDNPQPQMHFRNAANPFEDFFAQAFSGGSHPFGGFSTRHIQRNQTLNVQTQITLEEAFSGKDLLANIQLPSGTEQTVELKIPAGIQDGMTLRITGLGDDTYKNIPRGDIHLTVHVLPHTRFQRQGDDLYTSIDVSCIDAMLGTTAIVDTIDGKTIEVKVNPGAWPGMKMAAAGFGMPLASDNRFKGRLMINVNITIPTNLTEKQKDLLKEFQK